jgi:hypothetical protein
MKTIILSILILLACSGCVQKKISDKKDYYGEYKSNKSEVTLTKENFRAFYECAYINGAICGDSIKCKNSTDYQHFLKCCDEEIDNLEKRIFR